MLRRALGPLGLFFESLAWILLVLYVLPVATAPLLFRPWGLGGLPFSLGWAVAWTLGQAALSATLAVALGLPLGVLAGLYGSRLAWLAVAASMAPFMSPVVVAALGFRSVYGDTPLGFLAEGWSGVVALHSYFNIGLAALLVASSMGESEAAVVEQARLMGLRGPGFWRRTVLPLAARPAAYAWLVAFLYSATSAAPLLIHGARYRWFTLEAWLYVLFNGFPSLWGAAALLAAGEVAAAAAASLLVSRLAGGLAAAPIAARAGAARIPLRGAARLAAYAYTLGLLGYLYAPLAGVAVNAAGADPGVLEAYAAARGPGLSGAVVNSLAYAAATVAVSTVAGLAAALRRSLAAAAVSAVAVAPVAYGVAASLLYYRSLSPVLGAAWTSRMLIVLAHSAAALPLAGKSLEAGLARLHGEVVETMLLLGLRGRLLAGHLLRAVAPATVAAAGLAAAASLGEFGATIVVSVPETWSLTVLVYNLLGSGRLFHEACLAALVLEAMSLASLGVPLLIARKELWKRSDRGGSVGG